MGRKNKIILALLAAWLAMPVSAGTLPMAWDPAVGVDGYRVSWSTTGPPGPAWNALQLPFLDVPKCATPIVQPCYTNATTSITITYTPDPAIGVELWLGVKSWALVASGPGTTGKRLSANWSNGVSEQIVEPPANVTRPLGPGGLVVSIIQDGDTFAFASANESVVAGLAIPDKSPVGIDGEIVFVGVLP